MPQQNSDGDGHDRKRDNVTEASIKRFLKIKPPSYPINISCFLSFGWPPIFRYSLARNSLIRLTFVHAALHNLINYALPRTASASRFPRLARFAVFNGL
jgi:hypothetical protein